MKLLNHENKEKLPFEKRTIIKKIGDFLKVNERLKL